MPGGERLLGQGGETGEGWEANEEAAAAIQIQDDGGLS